MPIGEIKEFCNPDYVNTFRWKIPNFFSLPGNAGAFYDSPSFEFESSTWCLRLFPNGPKQSETKIDLSAWIGIFLRKQMPGCPKNILNFTLSIVDVRKLDYRCLDTKHEFVRYDIDWGWQRFLERSELLNNKHMIAPSDVVIICCRIYFDDAVEKTTQKHPPSETPSTSVTMPGLGTKNLICNLKDLFLKQKNCDITIRVKDQEFRAHRIILEARCPVFAAMLAHDFKENLSGVVEITDADPEDFREILLYIYSGDVEHFSTNNVRQLYVLADKYDFKDLKQECVILMENTLSAETVCDIIYTADIYGDVRMKNFANDFIRKNRCNVLTTDKWKKFESENLLLAYETIKSLYLEKDSKE